MALSKFRLHAGFAREEKIAVAEAIPALCKKERRLNGGMKSGFYKCKHLLVCKFIVRGS
jgi:hypothetical protein